MTNPERANYVIANIGNAADLPALLRCSRTRPDNWIAGVPSLTPRKREQAPALQIGAVQEDGVPWK